MSNLQPKKWSWSLKTSELWSPIKELLKQYLTEKQIGYLQSGHLWAVVVQRESSVVQMLYH